MRGWFLPALILTTTFSAWAAPVEVLSDGGVQITYEQTGDKGQIEAFRKAVLPAVAQILSDLKGDLGITKSVSHASVFFYSPETYAAKFPQTIEKQIPAFYDGSAVHAKADNDMDHSLKTTLRHELTHLLLREAYGILPGWLDEGLAQVEERKISADPIPSWVDYNTIVIAKQDGKFLPLEELDSNAYFGRSQGTVAAGLAYTTAFVAVSELKSKNGMDALRTFLSAISTGKEKRAAFEATFGMTYAKFNEVLVETSRKKTS